MASSNTSASTLVSSEVGSSSLTIPAAVAASTTTPNDPPIAANSSASPLKITVVTAKRKEELLLQARAERKQWVRRVPLPYDPKQLAKACGAEANGGSKSAVQQLWSSRDGLDKVQTSLICGTRFLPGATFVLSELYGMGSAIDDGSNDKETDRVGEDQTREYPLNLDEMAGRVERLAKPFWVDEQKDGNDECRAKDSSDEIGVVVDSTKVVPKSEKRNDSAKLLDSMYEDLRKAYADLTDAMMLPESAVTVQGMKNFVRQFATSTNNLKDDQMVRNMATSLNGHARSSYTSLVTKNNSNSININTATVGDNAQPDEDRRSLESFLYGQTKEILDSVLDVILGSNASSFSSGSPFSMTQSAFDRRLEELQFLQPSHLEIACLPDETASTTAKLETLLEAPIQALQSVEAFYSPYEKLCRVLEVFRGVNAALSKTSKAVPSADDVLPTVILVVVKAASNKKRSPMLKNLLRDLYFVESFALPEYLRGEAGYAFTNLYGAVQFLQELKLDTGDGNTEGSKSNRLSISPEELRKELEKSRAEATANHAKRNGTLDGNEKKESGLISRGVKELLGDSDLDQNLSFVAAPLELSVRDVRAARLQGVTPDLEWALRQNVHGSYREEVIPQVSPKKQAASSSSPTKSSSKSTHLPQRYTFLGVRPESVRVSDLPKLLDEYRKLVLTTEELLGEQQRANHKMQAEKKRHRDEKHRKSLGERALLL